MLDAETVGAVDITAVTMLTDLAGELQRRDRRLAVAHGIGQVRDMLREGEPAGAAALELHPTVAEAVEALSS